MKTDFARKKILVVDDEASIRQLVEAALNEKGYDASSASNGQEALKEIKNIKPHLVLLDVTMPGMNGLEVLQKVKKDKNTVGIPVIMLTANTDDRHIAAAMMQQADKYITKPFDLDKLLSEIENTLALQYGR